MLKKVKKNKMDIFFTLKKFISFFLQPYGLTLFLLITSLIALYINKIKAGKILLSSALAIFLLFSYPLVSNTLVTNLENKYSKYDYKTKVKYIHVLGNGHLTDKDQPLSSLLSSAGVKRVLEGVIIHKKSPNSILVFTGYSKDGEKSNAQINADLAIALGVDRKDIVINNHCKDTDDEARYMSSLIKTEPFALVTSATHMPRAIKLFRQYGLNPIAAPTDFKKQNFPSIFIKPGSAALYDSQIALHEYLGQLWRNIKNI